MRAPIRFIGDATTGRPLFAANRKPLGDDNPLNSFDDLWHVVTEPHAGFVFDKVPPGEYRLVAQSWSGTQGLPDRKQTSERVLRAHHRQLRR
jgi:hypothetical protein